MTHRFDRFRRVERHPADPSGVCVEREIGVMAPGVLS